MAPPTLRCDRAPAAVGSARVLAVLTAPAGDGVVVRGALPAGVSADIGAELTRAKAKGQQGEVVTVPLPPADGSADRLVLLGTGDGSTGSLRQAGAALGRAARGHASAAVQLPGGDATVGPDALRAFAEGLLLAAYARPRTGSPAAAAKRPVAEVVLHGHTDDDAVHRAVVTGLAAHRARDLANTPSDVKTPTWLAEQAAAMVAGSGVDVDVRDAAALAAGGFGGILGVGSGSAQPPCLIELTYRPRGRRRVPHIVLIGKGITFDSGGLSLKPAEAMLPMKTDMTGGGVVIAMMAALRDLGVRVRVTGLVAAAENMPGASALRPGDVITHHGGRTVEVFNTDAEGRLVLADALAYADRTLRPDAVVDLATLTGAASLGLGRRHAALYATDDALAAALLRASDASGERLWRMPLVDDYRAALDSDVADLSHISRDRHVGGGSITAALFLREFAGDRPWAHLDIAGPARADGDEHEVTKGGTGFGVRVLLRWLESYGG